MDLVKELENFSCKVSIYDPLADKEEVKRKYNLQLVNKPKGKDVDALVLAVPHDGLLSDIDEFVSALKSKSLIYDVKGVLPDKYEAKRL